MLKNYLSKNRKLKFKHLFKNNTLITYQSKRFAYFGNDVIYLSLTLLNT